MALQAVAFGLSMGGEFLPTDSYNKGLTTYAYFTLKKSRQILGKDIYGIQGPPARASPANNNGVVTRGVRSQMTASRTGVRELTR